MLKWFRKKKPIRLWAACDGGGNMSSGRTSLYRNRPTTSDKLRIFWGGNIFWGDYVSSYGLTKILGLKPGECAEIEIRRIK